MHPIVRAGLGPVLLLLSLGAGAARAAEDDTTRVVEDPRYGLVVSGTRTPRNALDVPATIDVVRGESLRRRGVRTLADALQDVPGLDLADGSDNGSRMPNIGVWGLKEFDALLISVDGVPMGGPFNPALEQIPVDDIDRIEITRGPQGTLYGLSAFAGMIQVFTRAGAENGASITQRVSSFHGAETDFSWSHGFAGDRRIRIAGSAGRGDGWQDRTEFTRFRTSATLSGPLGGGTASLQLYGLEDRQEWGTPVPIDQGRIVPGFVPERNDAVLGARIDHEIFGVTGNLAWPMGERMRLESTLGFTHDSQDLVRSFVDFETLAGDSVDAFGQRFEPEVTSAYLDARLVRTLDLAGPHEWVAGVAGTFGELKAEGGAEFTYNVKRLPDPVVPDLNAVTFIEEMEAEDKRTLIGFFLHDSWTPHPRVSLTGGGRLDLASEELEAGEPGEADFSKDEREDSDWSADGGLLLRLLAPAAEGGNAVNLFGNARRNFKPAAPNVFESAEGTRILEPERSVAFEGGLKSEAFGGQASLELSMFQMELENQVIVVDVGGLPALANAGKTRFKGQEVKLRLAPAALRGLSLAGGYAHHDPRFVVFTRPNGAFVNGNQIELAPKDLWNAAASYSGPAGLSLWVAGRGAGRRPLNKRNTFFTGAYDEWDAGVGLDRGSWSLGVAGRNLGDSRHVIGESEIGDAQFYIAPPRRFTGQLTLRL